MTIEQQIQEYIYTQPSAKRADMEALHQLMLQILPNGKLWFDNGTNEEGKVVTNPTVGYGLQTLRYADGKTKEFFQIGVSPNKTGITVYILGINDKKYLPDTYTETIGKASVTGYCIKFKKLKDIDTAVLQTAIRDGIRISSEK
ncbi:DUF1801 domain-containing protein [Mucilaginibacter myungsuensis]|uniref:DUF1801 domain-containing protein n=1 Tax=Mucilaginibacter myungsuensis TaxID=649104 RepID=A0A929KV12_9SPHI|nr:DUF1801 domain-containing protein [Mucilaginibacter myungsuensis]MBE9662094.1 DUF1801 domain-containing protein [Mucilaginibacter myungsuensis]MDN3599472.1 DUF1801 domain-containing protein [Mucilaginibacter myungsuensis]